MITNSNLELDELSEVVRSNNPVITDPKILAQ